MRQLALVLLMCWCVEKGWGEGGAIQPTLCPAEVDPVWDISWASTPNGSMAESPCGREGTGMATRLCYNSTWSTPQVMQCESMVFQSIRTRAEAIINGMPTSDSFVDIVNDLLTATSQFGNRDISLFPRDLETTNFVLTNFIDMLENPQNQLLVTMMDMENIFNVMNNVMFRRNLPGYRQLQEEGVGSQAVLYNTERIGVLVARNLNQPMSVSLVKENILVRAGLMNIQTLDGENVMRFPNQMEAAVLNISTNAATIALPHPLLVERAEEMGVMDIPTACTLFTTLGDFLPLPVNEPERVPRTFVVSGIASIPTGPDSEALKTTPITLNFTLQRDESEELTNPKCAFWNLSDPIGRGGWTTRGLTVEKVEGDRVSCTSDHLTAFCVLVTVGNQNTFIHSQALRLVSFIGCGISMLCLLLTIIFLLSYGKKLFEEVHLFIHLNLAISLFLGYLVFASGVEHGTVNKALCTAITATVQYFFLACFFWMLCEAIMLYLMIVVVFSDLTKKWWIFPIIGWFLPSLCVLVGLITVREDYTVHNDDGSLQYCWFSTRRGAIWAFAGPMLGIVVINTVVLVVVLATIRRLRKKQTIGNAKLAISLLKAFIVLLPLLGLTWVFGLFAVSENTAVFAWLFTIFNSLQGLFIFYLHVIRSAKVQAYIKKLRKSDSDLKRSYTGNTQKSVVSSNFERRDTELVDVDTDLFKKSLPGENKTTVEEEKLGPETLKTEEFEAPEVAGENNLPSDSSSDGSKSTEGTLESSLLLQMSTKGTLGMTVDLVSQAPNERPLIRRSSLYKIQ